MQEDKRSRIEDVGYEYLLDEVHHKVNREKIYIILHDNRIDVGELIKNRKLYAENSAKFNHILGIIKNNYHIQIYETLIYLDEDGFEINKTMKILNDDNKLIVRNEMAYSYRLKTVENDVTLDDLLS